VTSEWWYPDTNIVFIFRITLYALYLYLSVCFMLFFIYTVIQKKKIYEVLVSLHARTAV